MLLDHGFSNGPSRSARRRRLAVLGLLIASAALLSACGKSAAQKEREAEQAAKDAAYREKYAKAKALFEERCKTAGVVVKRVVKDVEGIELTKIRPKLEWGDKRYFDPKFDGAAMAHEASGPNYVWTFLQSEFRYSYAPNRRGTLAPPGEAPAAQQLPPIRGYRFVEYRDPESKQLLRCSASRANQSPQSLQELMTCESIKHKQAAYALDYEDISAPEDRMLWVAGTRLIVVDLKTSEVIAQQTRYVWDPGFGASSTGRWPWQYVSTAASTVCPSDATQPTGSDSRYFIDTILQPRQGDKS